MANLILPEESYRIIGACFRVHNEMGSGFLEGVYHECLGIEFREQGIPFVSQPKLELSYRGQLLEQSYEADFVCFGKILVEIKAVHDLIDEHRAQIINYLNATRFPLELLINFGAHPKLQHERFAFTGGRQSVGIATLEEEPADDADVANRKE